MIKPSEAELMTKVAWLYYIGDLNQAQVSNRLGLTRARVNKLLQNSRENGIVSINVNRKNLGLLELEEQIAKHFNLKFCTVTPELGLDTDQPSHASFARRAVGNQTSKFLRAKLSESPKLTIGTGWGRTLNQLSKNIAGLHAPQAKFVSLMGSLTANSAFNPFEVVQSMANSTSGEGFFLPVPYIADSLKDKKTLLSQRIVKNIMAMARNTDIALISVGEMTENSFLLKQGLVNKTELEELKKVGAIGDTNGIFFDSAGLPVNHELNTRTIAVEFKYLKQAETVLLSAGTAKLEATVGILTSGIITGLIIDGDSAIKIAKIIV